MIKKPQRKRSKRRRSKRRRSKKRKSKKKVITVKNKLDNILTEKLPVTFFLNGQKLTVYHIPTKDQILSTIEKGYSENSKKELDNIKPTQYPLTIYTKDGCPSCKKSKELLTIKKIPFIQYSKEGNEEKIVQLTKNYKFVPVILDRLGKFLGGYTELIQITQKIHNKSI
jgi:glutaredoxin